MDPCKRWSLELQLPPTIPTQAAATLLHYRRRRRLLTTPWFWVLRSVSRNPIEPGQTNAIDCDLSYGNKLVKTLVGYAIGISLV